MFFKLYSTKMFDNTDQEKKENTEIIISEKKGNYTQYIWDF